MFRRGGVANEGIMTGLVDRSVSADPTSGGLNSLVRPGYQEGGDVESGGFWNSIIGRTLKAPVDFLAKPVANVINPAVNALVGTEFEQMRTPYDALDAWTWNKLGKGQHDIYNPDGDPTTDDFKDRTDWGYANLGKGGHKDPDAIEWEDEDNGSNLNQPKIVDSAGTAAKTSRADDITAIYEDLLPMLQGTLGVDKDSLGRQKYLELAKFGANLMAQPGGSLTRAIGKAAEQPLEGLTRIAETKRKGKRAPAEIAMKIALSETESGPVGKQIRDLKKIYPQRKGETANEWNRRIGDKVLERGTATREATTEGRIAKDAVTLGEKLGDEWAGAKAARAIDATGLDTSYFKMLPKAKDDYQEGQHYIKKDGTLLLYDGKDILEWKPKKQKFE